VVANADDDGRAVDEARGRGRRRTPAGAAVAAMMAARNADAIFRFIIRLCSIWYGAHSVPDSDHREDDGK
jgi:hypothetical protein